MGNVTQILLAIDDGDPHAAEQLLPLVYDESRKLAAAMLAHEKPGQTLHEAFLRLLGPDGAKQSWNSRGHFFAAAAEAIRRLLVERARRKARLRHGGDRQRIDLNSQLCISENGDAMLTALDEALEKLAADEPIAAQVVKLRYFAGLTIEETAAAMNLSTRTVRRTPRTRTSTTPHWQMRN